MILGVAAAVFIAVAAPLSKTSFSLDQPAEVVATLHAGCERCDWGVAGREGAAVTIAVDGRYRANVMLTRGEDDAEYRVLLGRYARGSHTVTVGSDPSATAPGVGAVRVSRVTWRRSASTIRRTKRWRTHPFFTLVPTRSATSPTSRS